MGDWYEENIEEGVRDVVRALRDNGFNTECSCHHEMSVQMQYVPDGAIKRLHDLVWNYLDRKGLPVRFTIEMTHRVIDACQFSTLILRLPPREGRPGGAEAKPGSDSRV
jgi:hypothetical protein